MITCHLRGGLGNQLFQIFTTIAYAIQQSQPFFFLNNYQLGNGQNGVTIRYTYWETFLDRLKIFLKNDIQISNMLTVSETSFNYDKLPQHTVKDIMLYGYFQSYLYFDEFKDTIFKLIKIDSKKNILNQTVNIDFKNTISLHFRLGDYKRYPDVHPILPVSYYSNALQYLLYETTNLTCITNVLYFCEDGDLNEVIEMINELKSVYPELVFERAEPLLFDWEQLLLMSLCKYNVIANSTFSWWGAYFNENIGKKICYPSVWFGPKAAHNTKDLFPKDWNKIAIV
jgi:hypothetical protein